MGGDPSLAQIGDMEEALSYPIGRRVWNGASEANAIPNRVASYQNCYWESVQQRCTSGNYYYFLNLTSITGPVQNKVVSELCHVSTWRLRRAAPNKDLA